jgi:hypothetical protein
MNALAILAAAQTEIARVPDGNPFVIAAHRALNDALGELEESGAIRPGPVAAKCLAMLWRAVLGNGGPDPLPALLAEWIGLSADHQSADIAAEAAEAKNAESGPQLRTRADALCREMVHIEDRIIATAPTSLVGFYAKARFANLYHADNLAVGHVESDASVPENGVRLALERDLAELLGISLPQPVDGPQPHAIAAE